MKNYNYIIITLLLSGCIKVGSDYHMPDLGIPKSWVYSSQAADEKAIAEKSWWKNFNDPVLNALIDKALTNNPDVKIAGTRIVESRANLSAEQSSLLPRADVSAGALRQSNRIAFPGPMDLTQPFNTFQAGFDASWEMDLFGRHKRAIEAEKANLESSKALEENVKVSLIAEVARTYIDIRKYQAELEVVKNIVRENEAVLSVVKQRVGAGVSSGNDISAANAALEQAKSEIPRYEDMLVKAKVSMDILVGEHPGATENIIKDNKPIPELNGKLLLAAPASIIANRPDIIASERKLAAAAANHSVAIAKFFPDVSVSGFMGLLNVKSEELLKNKSKSWSLGGNALMPLLNYGALSANLDIAKAGQKEALENYRKNIIAALADVERAVSAYEKGEEQRKSIHSKVEYSSKMLKIADMRYKQGLTSGIETIDAKKTLYNSQLQSIEVDATQAQNLIAVYKSLGGGA